MKNKIEIKSNRDILEMETLFDKNVEYTAIETAALKKFFRKLGDTVEGFILSPTFSRDMDKVLKELQLDVDQNTIL